MRVLPSHSLWHFAECITSQSLGTGDTVAGNYQLFGCFHISSCHGINHRHIHHCQVCMPSSIPYNIISLPHNIRSLHNMRNYIHINLCINLGIAQLIFVAGIDQSASDHVPIHCQVIAVLLHYFFQVSFMWMLMEGVVLYVILIKVFVLNTKRYVLAFTIASYGIPLLYLGLLTLPLGFALPIQPGYGYNTA